MRYVDHITIDGKTYYTGTVFLTSGTWAGVWFDDFEVTFVAYDTEYKKVCFEENGMGGSGPHRNGRCTLEQFKKKIKSVKAEKH